MHSRGFHGSRDRSTLQNNRLYLSDSRTEKSTPELVQMPILDCPGFILAKQRQFVFWRFDKSLYAAAMLVDQGCTPTWRPITRNTKWSWCTTQFDSMLLHILRSANFKMFREGKLYNSDTSNDFSRPRACHTVLLSRYSNVHSSR